MLTSGACSAHLLRPVGGAHSEGPARIVAVSGGIGCGKSTVTRVFASRGAIVADADAIARQVLEPGTVTLDAVAQRFGTDLIRQDGTLDRPALAQRVFGGGSAHERIAELNALTHPAIEERAWRILRGAPAGTLAVYDIPLLVEGGYVDRFDAVVIVDAPEELRLQRLEARSVAREDARARIRAQASSGQRRAIANVWIDNGGSIADLQDVAAAVWQQWLDPATAGGN